MKKFLLLLLAALTLTSCTQDEVLNPIPEQTKTNDTYTVDVDEALSKAEKIYNRIYGSETRSTTSRKVSKIERFQPTQGTRSSENLNGYYIVNYGDNEGFALLGADTRLEDVYAISNQGSLQLSDTIHNKGLSWYINQLLPTEYNAPYGPTTGGGGLNRDSVMDKDDFDYSLTKGLIPYRITKFHQNAPYNKYCLTTEGKQSVVGCAALAMGTVMAYHKWPERFANMRFNWGSMIKDLTHDSWAQLFGLCGKLLGVNYYENSAGLSNLYNFRPAFTTIHYNEPAIAEFNCLNAKGQIDMKKPFIVAGSDRKIINLEIISTAHIWIIDGAYTEVPPYEVIDHDPTKYFFHCIWGWEGINNGYFMYRGETLGTEHRDMDDEPYIDVAPAFGKLLMIYHISPNI